MDPPTLTITRATMSVRCVVPQPGQVRIEVHPAGTADDCADCAWHLGLLFAGHDRDLVEASARHVALPEALQQVRDAVPLPEWRLLARGYQRLHHLASLVGRGSAAAEQYVPYAELASVLLTAPPRRRLQELTAAGKPWGVAPSPLIAGHYGVSTQTAQRWLASSHRHEQPDPSAR
ncbi:hypothetical protein [Angustibacter sp. Root456]|uniref:hypothetical protein n=1 Tax=Angustibacter sp. Root456 TaxID=1736539 RepID=UPI0006FB0E2C|nr:hypothetical protein [Angustibacter sp. Root456]KQX69931.1 hypothetical protein ASD06_02730 [Angustibacter sp. Root456]